VHSIGSQSALLIAIAPQKLSILAHPSLYESYEETPKFEICATRKKQVALGAWRTQ